MLKAIGISRSVGTSIAFFVDGRCMRLARRFLGGRFDARGVCVDVAFGGINCTAPLLHADQPYSIDVAIGPFSGLGSPVLGAWLARSRGLARPFSGLGVARWHGWGVTVRTLRACTISLPVKDLVVFASLWLVGELS